MATRAARGGDEVGQFLVVVGGSEDVHLVPEADQGAGEVDDVRLDSPWHVEGVRADDADLHRASLRTSASRRLSGRSASQSFCSMCQSAGWAAMSAANTSASCLGGGGTLPTLIGGWMRNCQPSSVNQQPDRQQRGAGRRGQVRGARGHQGLLAEERHGHAGRRQVAVG